MSANYWNSTQRLHWQFSRESLSKTRESLKNLETSMEQSNLISKIGVSYDTHMRIYIHSLVNKLGRKLNIRQVALSTAEVYLMRFFTKSLIKEINLYLLITTSIYLACKIEECPQHIRTIVSEARNIWPEYIPHDATKVAELEFYLIEGLDSYLVVHHSYRSLLQINEALTIHNSRLNPDTKSKSALSPEELQSCWSIINDSYVTDLPLLYPPHIIATTSVYLTLVLKYNHIKLLGTKEDSNFQVQYKFEMLSNFTTFLGHSNINLKEVVEAVQDIITLYEQWESYDENSCKKPLERILLNR